GPWEAGWMIDTKTNKDGQPKIITGQIYGQHCKMIADSMRAAATKIGTKISIGGQVLHYDGTTSWNNVDKTWNSGFFKEIGDAVDFYVMHNYFGTAATMDNLLSVALTEPKKNINFIQQDIVNKKAFPKPVALTEYNINTQTNPVNASSPISYINGMQATILFNELIKNNFGLGARWLLASGADAMFYQGDNASLLWQPRPDFYYAYYQQKFTGDHVISATSNNSIILAYASRFASGETGVVIVNRGKTAQIVKIDPKDIGVGNQYYNYTLTGGTDNGDFSLYVSVNGVSPTGTQWGPRESLESIPASAYSIDDAITLNSPGRSVQFIMVEAGTKKLYPTSLASELKNELELSNYPNPFSTSTTIQFQTPSNTLVSLEVFDQTGKKVTTLLNEVIPSGIHQLDFDGSILPGGIYYYQLTVGKYSTTRKMIHIK
ncbi:MAG TPA: T9SS type A sorting domain-containing protein, partial [Prolixibacteraceae bacterium]